MARAALVISGLVWDKPETKSIAQIIADGSPESKESSNPCKFCEKGLDFMLATNDKAQKTLTLRIPKEHAEA